MNHKLNFFLKYGYFPDYNNEKFEPNFSLVKKSKYQNLKEEELSKIFIRKLRSSVKSKFDCKKNHLVYLSGGLDSRLILAVLSELVDINKIHTLTWGTPGSFNYEFGNLIAKKLNTKHHIINLDECDYTQSELLEYSKRTDMQTILFHFPPISKIKKFKTKNNFTIWTGFPNNVCIGDFYKNRKLSKDSAIKRYFKKIQYIKSPQLTNPQLDDNNLKIYDKTKLRKNDVDYFEQILLFERVKKWTGPHLMPRGFNYANPFFNTSFSDFMFSIDESLRYGANFFRKNCYKYNPELFTLPTTTNYGFGLNFKAHQFVMARTIKHYTRTVAKFKETGNPKEKNYLNFDFAFRHRNDLIKLAKENLTDLSKRKILYWLNPEEILHKHLSKEANYANALIILISLEIHLKNNKNID